MTDDQQDREPPADEPTVTGSVSGNLDGPVPQPEEPTLPADEEPTHAKPTLPSPISWPTAEDDEPTFAQPNPPAEPTLAEANPTDQPTLTTPDNATTPGPAAGDDEPTLAEPVNSDDEPTLTAGTDNKTTLAEPAASDDEPNLAEPVNSDDEPTLTAGTNNKTTLAEPATDDEPTLTEPLPDEEPTLAVGTDDPTSTGPTVGTWPFDQFEPAPHEELVWRVESPPAKPAAHSPAYYLALGAAVVLVVGLVALAAVVAVVRPRQEIAGSAGGLGVPEITTSGAVPPAPPSTTVAGPFAELAAHPLSSSTARMPDVTCSLPRFDPADDRQADFYAAAKVCADAAWRPFLAEAGLDGDVTVVTLTGPAETQSCGDLAPDSPPTQCEGTVYLTPAYLRDAERNGRYPGRYLGVFLREYARALQFTTGVEELVAALTTGSAADIDTRVEQQATCLAGVVAGSMSGRGAIDSNITAEIRDRLSTVDAPPDAKAWLDKGFRQRTPAACNSWAG